METVETDSQGRMSKARSHSFSGKEPNFFYHNRQGKDFRDLSGLSGLDTRADSRAFAMLDLDRDGWLDAALVNANAPQLNLYRNNLAGLVHEPRNVIAVRFVGGSSSAGPTPEWSNRDGIGASVRMTAGGVKIVRELRAGDGFASQNSATLLVGLGPATNAEDLVVRWPSGKTQSLPAAPAGTLVTFFENPTPDAVREEPYLRPAALPAAVITRSRLTIPGIQDSPAMLRVATTFETWCDTCKAEHPHFKRLRGQFKTADVEFFGLPSDPEETIPAMKNYVAAYNPSYAIIGALAPKDRLAIRKFFESELKAYVLPSTVVLNRDNEVLAVYRGVPTVSNLRRLLAGE